MLRGADLSKLWIEVAALAALIVVAMTVAIVRFRKRLD
jgi:ABC-2 type transport system permease protein